METKEKETELVQLVRQLWAAISLIGIKLAIPVAKIVKYTTMAKKLVKDDKNINKKLLSIRLKIANKENEVRV